MTDGVGLQRARTAIVLLVAALALLSVWIVNGRPLFYYDTAAYVKQGQAALAQLGLIHLPEAAAGDGTGGATVAKATVDGSRSPVFSVLAGGFAAMGAIGGLLVPDLLALLLMVGLAVRVIRRTWMRGASGLRLGGLALIVASLGSLPFYVAYLMPDLLTPVLILAVAALAIFGSRMGPWELVLGYLLASFATVVHLSHLPIAILAVGAGVVLAWFIGRRGWWKGPAVLVLVLLTAFAQQAAFRAVAAKAAHAEVTILPFLTARLIQDGPGQTWLAARCPDAGVATCLLWAELQKSDDPYRLTASHIVFEKGERLGSFQHLSEADRAAVSRDQIAFAKSVVRAYPFAVAGAFLHNVGLQFTRVSVVMTLPSDTVVGANTSVTEAMGGPLAIGRLGWPAPWADPLTRAQSALYAAALGFVLALVVLPGALPREMRLFVLMILAGILANAAVCGGISQPSDRYGSRVIWLLPFTAVLAGGVASRRDP